MKKVLSLVFATVLLAGCSQDIRRNDVAFQALKNNTIWRASTLTAIQEADGSITIGGSNLSDRLEITINNTAPGKYILGNSNIRTASYFQKIGTVESTFETTNTKGSGEVNITQFDGVTITGTFMFTAPNVDPDSDQELVNFQKGIIYKVPVTVAQ